MTGHELIEALQKCDLSKPVFIQQGEEFDYTVCQSVVEDAVIEDGRNNDDDETDAILIRFI